VSDLEVESEEETGKIWEIAIRSPTAAATSLVRNDAPETMLGDVAVAVNPDIRAMRTGSARLLVLPWSAARFR
jgi:valyl-tRNA synthetase